MKTVYNKTAFNFRYFNVLFYFHMHQLKITHSAVWKLIWIYKSGESERKRSWQLSTNTFSELNPVHILTSYLYKIHFNIILPYIPSLQRGLLSSGFTTKILNTFLIYPYVLYVPLIFTHWFCHPNIKPIWRKHVKNFNVKQFPPSSIYLSLRSRCGGIRNTAKTSGKHAPNPERYHSSS
jgi:hypothetical protein